MKGRKQQHSAKKVKTQSKQHTKSAKATNTKNTKKGTRKSHVNRRMNGGDTNTPIEVKQFGGFLTLAIAIFGSGMAYVSLAG